MSLFANTKQLAVGADKQLVMGNGDRRPRSIIVGLAHVGFMQNLAAVRIDDLDRAGVIHQINFTVSRGG